MKFAYTRLVTEDVSSLASFYEKLLGTPPKGSDDYVELHPGGPFSQSSARKPPVTCTAEIGPQAQIVQRSLNLKSTMSIERIRVEAFVTDWVQQPKDMPWGNRSMLFRDPDGNPINLFRPTAKP